MKVAKVIISIFFLCVLQITLFSVSAQEFSYEKILEEVGEQQLEESGANELIEYLDDDTLALIKELGVDCDLKSLINISPKSLFEMLGNILRGQLKNPVSLLSKIIFIVLICSLLECFKISFIKNPLSDIFSLVGAVMVGLVVIIPLMECVSHVCSAIMLASKFMIGFLPVITILLISAGKPISASGLNLVIFIVAEFISYISTNLLMPMICIYLAFSITLSLSPEFKLSGLAESVKKTINFILGFLSTIFVSLISFQGMLGKSVDNVATRTTKYVLGNFVPVIGGAIGDTITTVQGCIGLTKNTVASFGLVAVVLIFTPVLIEVALWIISIQIGFACSSLFELSGISNILKSISYTLSLLMSCLIFSSVLIIISTGVLASIGGGT